MRVILKLGEKGEEGRGCWICFRYYDISADAFP